MIKQLLKKPIYSILLLAITLCFVASCDESDDTHNPFLASLEAPENFLDSDDRLFLLASDRVGETIAFAEVKNGTVTELNSDSFKDSTFTFSFISIITDINFWGVTYKSLWGNSYHGLKRGVKAVLSKEDDHLTFTCQNFDTTTASEYSIASNSNSSPVHPYPEGLTGDLYVRNSSTRLFITKYDLDYKAIGYAFPSTIHTSGATPIINLSQNYDAFQTEIVEVADATRLITNVYGLPTANSFEEQYFISRNSGDQSMVLKYPGTLFPAYASYSTMLGDDFYYEAYNKSQKSDFTPMDLNATLTVTGQTLEYSVSGSGHIVYFDFNHNQTGEGNQNFDWNLYAAVGSNQSVTLPELPPEITVDFPDFSNDGWKQNEEIHVMEIETIYTINDFFNVRMKGSLFHTLFFQSLNSKSMRLNLVSSAAREFEMKTMSENPWEKGQDSFKGRFERD